MVNIVPVDRERHGRRGWRRLETFGFAAEDAVVPVTGGELAQALVAMPIGFVEQAGRYTLVGLMAVKRGANLFVGPDGKWLGNYLPLSLRRYPFSLIRREGSDQGTLAIDEDSGVIVDELGENIARFFEADGTPSSATKAVTEFLGILEREQASTQQAVSALAEADVIKPWPLTVPLGDEQLTVSGLHQVNEPALNALDDATFLKLRRAGSLIVAHGQLLSMAQVSVLTRFSLLQKMAKGPLSDTPPLEGSPRPRLN